ncbi:MAG: hypothetical protein QW795_03455 [Candidatus Bathyarchaeia archaeon]
MKSEELEKLVQGIIDGRIGTSCCPEIDEVYQRYKRGEATVEELKQAVFNKWKEAV